MSLRRREAPDAAISWSSRTGEPVTQTPPSGMIATTSIQTDGTMRTNIEIDERLMAEAMAASGLPTKRATVEAALRLLARRKRQACARDLFGSVQWQGDLDAERCDGPDGQTAG